MASVDFTFGGDYVAGETRFAGSVRDRMRSAALEVLARESQAILNAERAGYVLSPASRARKDIVARELVDWLFASEVAP